MTKAMVTINPEINMGVLAGIITGLVGGAVYNRWSGIDCLIFLSFFGGKRFVPIATGFFCLVLALFFGYTSGAGPAWHPIRAVNGSFRRRAGFRYLWLNQPSADPHRSASGTEHHRTVPDWRIHQCRRLYSTAISALLCWRRHGGDVYVRLLPDHDVWSAGRRSGDVFRRAEERRPMVGGHAAVCRDHAFLTGNQAAGIPCLCSRRRCCASCTPF